MIKLKPCPFCGNEAEQPYNYGTYGGRCEHWAISCEACGASSGFKTTPADVSALWDKRATIPPVFHDVEEFYKDDLAE